MTETLAVHFRSLPAVRELDHCRALGDAEQHPLTYRIEGAAGAVVLLACSVLINAQGGVLRSSICWNLKAHDVESVDQNPARV